MDNKGVILPALALGLGLGVGMSATLQKWTAPSSPTSSDDTSHLLQMQLLSQVLEGRDCGVSFDDFPYYLSEQTKVLLTNAACVHLKQLQYSKFTRNLSPASRTVLLSGPAGTETYHQMLAKGLAHSFEAKLLILDITDFSRKISSKSATHKESSDLTLLTKNLANEVAQRLLGLFGSDVVPVPGIPRILSSNNVSNAKTDSKSDPAGANVKKEKSWPFEDKKLVIAIYKVLRKVSESSPVILYLRDVEKLIDRAPQSLPLFQKMINKLSGPVFVLGSRVVESTSHDQVGRTLFLEKLAVLFPYKIDTKAPEDSKRLLSWKSQLEEDMKAIRAQDNRNHILEVLAANDVECEDMDSVCFSDSLLSDSLIEEIVVSAISHHLMNTDKPHHRSGRLVISSQSLVHGLNLFQAGQLDTKDAKLQLESNPERTKDSPDTTVKIEFKSSSDDANKKDDADASKKNGDAESTAAPTAKETMPDNEFEKRIRPEIIPAGEIGVSFNDIGALEDVKDVLQEAVLLPLRRPELFNKGGLIKPSKGVLLFGPPGTGKTMLAKAVATEAGASFINVSMSTITSKWFGEDEKNVKALFTLAAKVAPTIIFIDEVDSMLGQRSRNGEHEAMRKIKNEFMAHWDGLLSKPGQRVLVLAATNRPFDLDDAIIRRFERRIMVGLPDKNNREKILRAILEKETVADDLDYGELANMTEGYSGSDLKNLCVVAAYRPLKELLMKEKKRIENKAPKTTAAAAAAEVDGPSVKTEQTEKAGEKTGAAAGVSSCDSSLKMEQKDDNNDDDGVLQLRPLNMEDIKQAKGQVSSSFAAEGSGMTELKSWNELFGEGGSRKKQQLTYFL